MKAALRIVLAFSVVSIATVFLPDKALAQLVNMSTRGFVGTGDNALIGGFIIGGTSPVEVLIRGRGRSMSGAPFFVPGTLANTFLQILSEQTVIASNDNWQATQQAEIIATGLDPCRPNPGQSTSPPGCTQESAILLTLPPGAYTAILSGVGGATGVGLIEVFELIGGVAPPNILSTHIGSALVTQANCQNPGNNGTFGSIATVNISGQNASIFSGTGSFAIAINNVTINLFGTVTGGGALAGSFNGLAVPNGFQSSGTFTGSVIGKTMTINISGQVTVGETCIIIGVLSASRR